MGQRGFVLLVVVVQIKCWRPELGTCFIHPALHPRTHITGIPQYSVVSYLLRRFTDFSVQVFSGFSGKKQKAPTWVDSGY